MLNKTDKPNVNTKEYLDTFYANPEWRKDYQPALDRLKLLASVMPDYETLLDVGCADGSFSEMYHKRHNETSLFGCDISSAVINQISVTGDFRQADLYHLPWGYETFHAVTCSEVLEHLDYPFEALREMHRVLKKDGYIYITTPNSRSADYDEHLWRWNLEGINDLIRGYFRIDEEKSSFFNDSILYVQAQKI